MPVFLDLDSDHRSDLLNIFSSFGTSRIAVSLVNLEFPGHTAVPGAWELF